MSHSATRRLVHVCDWSYNTNTSYKLECCSSEQHDNGCSQDESSSDKLYNKPPSSTLGNVSELCVCVCVCVCVSDKCSVLGKKKSMQPTVSIYPTGVNIHSHVFRPESSIITRLWVGYQWSGVTFHQLSDGNQSNLAVTAAPSPSCVCVCVCVASRRCLLGVNVLFIIFLPPVLSDVMTVNQSRETERGRERGTENERQKKNTELRRWEGENKMKSVFVSSNYHNANVKPLDFLHLVSQTLVNLTLVSPLASASQDWVGMYKPTDWHLRHSPAAPVKFRNFMNWNSPAQIRPPSVSRESNHLRGACREL